MDNITDNSEVPTVLPFSSILKQPRIVDTPLLGLTDAFTVPIAVIDDPNLADTR